MPRKAKPSVPTWLQQAYLELSDDQRYSLFQALPEEERLHFQARLMNDPEEHVGKYLHGLGQQYLQAITAKKKLRNEEETKEMLRLRREKKWSWGKIGTRYGISADGAMRRCQRAELRGL